MAPQDPAVREALLPVPEVDQPIRRAAVHCSAVLVDRQGRDGTLLLQEGLREEVLRALALELPAPDLNRSIRRPSKNQAVEARHHRVDGIFVGRYGFQALEIGYSPYLESFIPRSRV